MCVAIYKPFGVHIPTKRLREAHEANPDGCGFMWWEHGLVTLKGCFSFDDFYRHYIAISNINSEMVIHFRTASSGTISDENCHPLQVNDDLAFVENGNLFETSGGSKTDIQIFNDIVLKRLPEGFLRHIEIKHLLEKYCKESMTKMIFMDSTGTVTIINEGAGEWVDRAWYSNGGIKEYIGYGYSGAYYYNPKDIRHKGGVVTPQLFPQSRRKNWQQCKWCLGYFYKLNDDCCSGCKTFNEFKLYTIR